MSFTFIFIITFTSFTPVIINRRIYFSQDVREYKDTIGAFHQARKKLLNIPDVGRSTSLHRTQELIAFPSLIMSDRTTSTSSILSKVPDLCLILSDDILSRQDPSEFGLSITLLLFFCYLSESVYYKDKMFLLRSRVHFYSFF